MAVVTGTIERAPLCIRLSCRVCQGTSVVWGEGVSLLDSHLTGQPMSAGREVDCPACDGSGRDLTPYWVGDVR